MDRPILFSGPMVRAILEGRKTQTRRVIHQPSAYGLIDLPNVKIMNCYPSIPERGVAYHVRTGGTWKGSSPLNTYRVGDRLYVREAWRTFGHHDHLSPSEIVGEGLCAPRSYEADNPGIFSGRLRQGMHLPKEFSRIWLEVTAVRGQRVQEITEEDAQAEGIEKHVTENLWKDYGSSEIPTWTASPIKSFKSLWDSLNAKPRPRRGEDGQVYYESFPWDGVKRIETHRGQPHQIRPNPWVAAYTFNPIEKPSL